MKKAAVVVLLLAGVAAVAGEAGIMDGFFIVRRLPFQAEKGRFSEYFPGRGG